MAARSGQYLAAQDDPAGMMKHVRVGDWILGKDD
jgi:hypothetical protein